MKTIAEISLECGVHRTTLNKAIKRKEIDATLYGKTYVIDTESERFKQWLAAYPSQSRVKGRKLRVDKLSTVELNPLASPS